MADIYSAAGVGGTMLTSAVELQREISVDGAVRARPTIDSPQAPAVRHLLPAADTLRNFEHNNFVVHEPRSVTGLEKVVKSLRKDYLVASAGTYHDIA